MIIDKEYNNLFNYSNFFNKVREDSHKIVLLMKNTHSVSHNLYIEPLIVFMGIISCSELQKSDKFVYCDNTIKSINTKFIGFAKNMKIYHDKRLKSNQAILSSSFEEIETYITIKNRKEKLLKIQLKYE